MNLIPNVPSPIFTLSATVIGFALLDDSTANEQNALGNWFMLVGQVLCTNASHNYVKNERKNINNFFDASQPESSHNPSDDTLSMMKKIRTVLDKEIANMEKPPS